MIRAVSSIFALTLVVPSLTTELPALASPCPGVFRYEPRGTEPGKWYGVISLTSDTTLYALWLNIVLETKAELLGNWLGEVTTEDNIDFQIQNTKITLSPGKPLNVRFFVQYDVYKPPPKLQAIRFNGKEICDRGSLQQIESELPVKTAVDYEEPVKVDVTTCTPVTASTSYVYDSKPTTVKPIATKFQYWQQMDKSTSEKPQYWPQKQAENNSQINTDEWKKTTYKPHDWTEANTQKSHEVNSEVHTTLMLPYWQQTTKTENLQHTTVKPIYWTLSNKYQTTVRPNVWSQVKVDNNRNITTKSQVQTTPNYSAQTTTPRIWSQTKVKTNQTRPTEMEHQSTTTKPQPWFFIKVVDNKQPVTQDMNTKLDINQQTIPISTVENSTKAVTAQSQLLTQKIGNNQQTKLGYQLQNGNISYTTVKPPPVKVSDNKSVTTEASQQTLNKNQTQTKVKKVVIIDIGPKMTEDNTRVVENKSNKSEIETPLQNKQENLHFVWPETQQNIQASSVDSTHGYDQLIESTPLYVRPEDRQKVSDNRFGTIGSTQNTTSHTENEQKTTPVDSPKKSEESSTKSEGLEVKPITNQSNGTEKPTLLTNEKTSNLSGNSSQSWDEASKFQSAGDASSYSENSGIKQFDGGIIASHDRFQLTTQYIPPVGFKKEEPEYYEVPKKEDKIDYYFGGLPAIYVPDHATRNFECGKVLLEYGRDYPKTPTMEGQWPWQIALYQQQSSENFKYICGGTLVSRRHILTAAHCVTKKGSTRTVNKNSLTIYLGKHNLKTSIDGVQVKFVQRILVHPEYNTTNFGRDLAILELEEPARYSEWVQPACLWPQNEVDLKYIVGQRGSVVGWGYELDGEPREELSLLEMPVVDQVTCLRAYPEFYAKFTSDKTYCAGYREGSTVCNGDSGGGMVFKKEGLWFVRGIASLAAARQNEYRCHPDHYVVFTDLAKFLPWIQENIDYQ